MEPVDDVAVVTCAVESGGTIAYLLGGKKQEVVATQEIPRYHKVAVRRITQGEVVRKYGTIIGEATQDIAAGSHVHTHNIDSTAKKE